MNIFSYNQSNKLPFKAVHYMTYVPQNVNIGPVVCVDEKLYQLLDILRARLVKNANNLLHK